MWELWSTPSTPVRGRQLEDSWPAGCVNVTQFAVERLITSYPWLEFIEGISESIMSVTEIREMLQNKAGMRDNLCAEV